MHVHGHWQLVTAYAVYRAFWGGGIPAVWARGIPVVEVREGAKRPWMCIPPDSLWKSLVVGRVVASAQSTDAVLIFHKPIKTVLL
jgi:hypothetical protein